MVFSRQLHFSQNRTDFSERKRSRIEEVFHTSWQNHAHIGAFSLTFGSFSHIGAYSVDGRFLNNLHLQFPYPTFSYFLSFSFVLPCCGFQASFPTMAHGCSTDVDNPAFPRATRAHSLGFCCFCFHNLHRVPKKRSRKREKTTLILIPYSPTFSPHI